MTSTSSPRQLDTSPLLALPTELKLQIISCIPRGSSPSLACLRRTHTSFLNLIPKSEIRSKTSSFRLRCELFETEMSYPYLLPLDHYPCYSCFAVLSVQNFEPYATQTDHAIGGARALHRFCSRCCEENLGPQPNFWKMTVRRPNRSG